VRVIIYRPTNISKTRVFSFVRINAHITVRNDESWEEQVHPQLDASTAEAVVVAIQTQIAFVLVTRRHSS